MKIGVHGKEFNRQSAPYVEKIFDILVKHKVEIFVSLKFKQFLSPTRFRKYKLKTFDHGSNLRNFKFLISLGGDGTLLETITYVGKMEVPVLGINMGRLGFLATIAKEDTEEALGKIFEGSYTLDQRALLSLRSSPDVFGKLNFGLNDFSLVKKDSSSMITIHTYIDGEFLNSYWADGIIISTPTGSTGYSLSCGGPLIFPRSGNFVITPVSPHNLTVRPIVVADSSKISFEVEGRTKKFLVSLDSRIATVDSTVKLEIQKAGFKVNLIQLEGQHYFKTLRQKLNWGLDIRN